jgi:hypothetical protein
MNGEPPNTQARFAGRAHPAETSSSAEANLPGAGLHGFTSSTPKRDDLAVFTLPGQGIRLGMIAQTFRKPGTNSESLPVRQDAKAEKLAAIRDPLHVTAKEKERNSTMSKPKLRELRKALLKALRDRHATDWQYKRYCAAWGVYATARIEAGRPISDAEYNRLHAR